MKWAVKIVRALLVTALLVGLGVPALLYVALSLPAVNDALRQRAERELSALLGASVGIGGLEISPFNGATLTDVTVAVAPADTVARIERLGAAVQMGTLATDGKLVVSYVELIGLRASVSRATPGAPLNIQPIIDALSPADDGKPPTLFDFRINTVVIRRSQLAYDILSAPAPAPGRLDASHLRLDSLRADISLPRLANDNFTIDLRSFSATERSGLRIADITGVCRITGSRLEASNPRVRLGSGTRLVIADMAVGLKPLERLDAQLLEGTRIVPADLSALLPALSQYTVPVDLTLKASATPTAAAVDRLWARLADGSAELQLSGAVQGLGGSPEVALDALRLKAAGPALGAIIRSAAPGVPATDLRLAALLVQAGAITLDAKGRASDSEAQLDGVLTTAAGSIDIDAAATYPGRRLRTLRGSVAATDVDASALTGLRDLGRVSLDARLDALFASGRLQGGSFNGTVSRIDWRGRSYTGITADVTLTDGTWQGRADITDPDLQASVSGTLTPDPDLPQLDLRVTAAEALLSPLGILPKQPHHRLTLDATASLAGRSIDDAVGRLDISRIAFVDPQGRGLDLTDVSIDLDNRTEPRHLTISSAPLTGHIEGSCAPSAVVPRVQQMLSRVLPALVKAPAADAGEGAAEEGDLRFAFALRPDDSLESFLKLPVDIVEPINIEGAADFVADTLGARISAPYIIKGGTMLQGTTVTAAVSRGTASLGVASVAVLKKDEVSISLEASAARDSIDTSVSWAYNRPRRYDGALRLGAALQRRDADGGLLATVDLKPSECCVADTVWTISPCRISVDGPRVDIDSLLIAQGSQHISITGSAGPDPDCHLSLELADISLDYIFETLAIDNVMFGGVATGRFTASELYTAAPRISTPALIVKRLSYNHSLMGDAIISSAWDAPSRSITLLADISQPNGRHSKVDGRIMPMTDSLDFHFDADRIRIGFMRPFMAAFADEVDGYASGRARLWGSFKYIDMVGDILAEDLSLKLDFTGTEYYTTRDSVHLAPGYITFSDVTLRDAYGNTARLDGWLRHEYFKRPRFEFEVSDARGLLVYDKPGDPMADLWYGRVFGNGSARINGEPGRVDIGVSMATTEHSTFTFVISDAEVADEYTFITFRDRTPRVAEVIDTRPAPVLDFLSRRTQSQDDRPSDYNMDISVDVTPAAEVVLVMDPVGGDRIRAHGEGHLRLTYRSASEDLRMYGDYTLQRGSYNFTLQDIIIKDFNILDGSSITFNGDPYAAQLDISAEYVVQANLSDLDESFLQDKDLNRTNVPVHAVMLVTGDMRSPDIAFDLRFPTLNSDIDRKVRSIVSTDDMMSRQIVYLLALNRFYTPEYMASTTRGSELVSVASSTITSQIGNMLGKISDNWRVAPALRSDKGDFTDVEFDLVLTSQLLNNRLLLNGNFGYRDKSLNNNSFIGDFDIEYLLNRNGTLRLKAYNHYNDQNYYVKSALTTQGVGILWRIDFDRFFRRSGSQAAPADTTQTAAP